MEAGTCRARAEVCPFPDSSVHHRATRAPSRRASPRRSGAASLTFTPEEASELGLSQSLEHFTRHLRDSCPSTCCGRAAATCASRRGPEGR